MKISDKRKRYYMKIYIYEKRREKIRGRLGVKNNKSPKNVSQEYRDAVAQINKKIKEWKHEIRTIDALTKKLHSLEMAVVRFVGTKIRDINGQNIPPEVTLAKGIFYKYAQENGLRGVDALRFIGGKGVKQALFYRKRFTNSFKNNPKNKEIWLQFKDFYYSTQNAA